VVSRKPAVQEASAALPRRFAKGTRSVTPTRGVAQAGAYADEPTVMELGLVDRTQTDFSIDSDRTTPNLLLADRTRPGLVLPTSRGRLAR
jgi:hypothetical protein